MMIGAQRPSKKTRRAGFTLLELLVALALLAFIGATLANSLTVGIRVLNRSAALEETIDPIALRIRLRSWLSQAASPAFASSVPIHFNGDISAFEFVTRTSTPFAPEAFGMIVQVVHEESALRLRASLIDSDGATFDEINGLLALSENAAIIRYYDGRTSEWVSEWVENDSLPVLVRIELPETADPQWPEFTVRLTFAHPITN
ncbi:prepilin-type N-terminal cleavage/methylation domain-containing protein [Fontisubflavum oceani]|uniref:prepilin-type N-terminal cleavage/methylation domain-containing protein n=1 Tax=Fontisubflavum oceani TaxID=2978973 RepID=UPI0025B4AA0F|nr:prepilin-type N-terminal cleavage/methylation domain-containing protein [Fontisubflavum oceani]WJY20390.1 prepilin-type N-terminal cleavage/methylation domain-containing protein [Fontisubflavum oceani]